MTADVLSPALLHRPTPVDFDFLHQAAFAAMTHPGGRPWRLRPVDRGVELRADGLHGLPPGGVGLQTIRIAAGMALLNMRLAVAANGNCPVTVLLPDRSRPRVLAVLRGGSAADPTPGERALFGAALAMGRQAPVVGPGPVPRAVLNGVRSGAETERAWLRSIADAGERARIAEQVPAVREYGTAGLLVVVGSNHDAPAAHLHAGQAAQRIALTSLILGHAAAVAAWARRPAVGRPAAPVGGWARSLPAVADGGGTARLAVKRAASCCTRAGEGADPAAPVTSSPHGRPVPDLAVLRGGEALVQPALVQTTADPLERVETRFLRNILGGEARSEPAVAKIGVRPVVHGGGEGVAADGGGVGAHRRAPRSRIRCGCG